MLHRQYWILSNKDLCLFWGVVMNCSSWNLVATGKYNSKRSESWEDYYLLIIYGTLTAKVHVILLIDTFFEVKWWATKWLRLFGRDHSLPLLISMYDIIIKSQIIFYQVQKVFKHIQCCYGKTSLAYSIDCTSQVQHYDG